VRDRKVELDHAGEIRAVAALTAATHQEVRGDAVSFELVTRIAGDAPPVGTGVREILGEARVVESHAERDLPARVRHQAGLYG
jgi:hypothetical protein